MILITYTPTELTGFNQARPEFGRFKIKLGIMWRYCYTYMGELDFDVEAKTSELSRKVLDRFWCNLACC